jgi:hypothetical protein
MPRPIPRNHIEHGPTESLDDLAKTLAIECSEDSLSKLIAVAEAEGWQSSTYRVHSSQVLTDRQPRPHSRKAGALNPWFRLGIGVGEHGTSTTVDVQPIFTEGVRPTGESALFVRKYNGQDGFVPGLHAIFEIEQELELRYYELLGNLSLELTVASVTGHLNHQSTLDILGQHRAPSGSFSLPLERILNTDGFGD